MFGCNTKQFPCGSSLHDIYKDIPVSSNNVYSIPSTLYATPSSPNVIQKNSYSSPTSVGSSYMDPTNHSINTTANESNNPKSSNGYLVAKDPCNGYLVAQDSRDSSDR